MRLRECQSIVYWVWDNWFVRRRRRPCAAGVRAVAATIAAAVTPAPQEKGGEDVVPRDRFGVIRKAARASVRVQGPDARFHGLKISDASVALVALRVSTEDLSQGLDGLHDRGAGSELSKRLWRTTRRLYINRVTDNSYSRSCRSNGARSVRVLLSLPRSEPVHV